MKRKSILISDRADFRPRKVTRDKERYYIMIMWPVPQEDKITFNMY